MTIIKIINLFETLSAAVGIAIDGKNRSYSRDLVRYFEKEILTDEFLASSNKNLISQYKNLYSQLRSMAFPNLLNSEILSVFNNDIGVALNWDVNDLKDDIDFFFIRFNVEGKIKKQQTDLMNSLLANKQRLTKNPIIVDGDRKIAPSVGNWIKYFYKEVGGQSQAARLKVAEFFSHDSNLHELASEERQRVKNLIELQEYLRRPLSEIVSKLQDFSVDFGDGNRIVVYGGQIYDFYDGTGVKDRSPKILESARKEAEIRQRSSSPAVSRAFREKREIRELHTVSEKAKMHKVPSKLAPRLKYSANTKAQTIATKEAAPVVPRLKPIKKQVAKPAVEHVTPVIKNDSSVGIKKLDKPKNSLAPIKNTLPQIIKSKLPAKLPAHDLVKRPSIITPVTPQPPETLPVQKVASPVVVKKELSLEDRIKKIYEGDLLEAQKVAEYQGQFEKSVNGNKQKLVDQSAMQILSGNKERVIAALYAIASQNLFNELINHALLQNIVIKYYEKNNLNNKVQEFKLSTDKTLFLPIMLRAIFESRIGLESKESARLALHINTFLRNQGNENYNEMAFFDMETETFTWAE